MAISPRSLSLVGIVLQVMPVYEYDISDIMAELVNDFDNTNSAVCVHLKNIILVVSFSLSL